MVRPVLLTAAVVTLGMLAITSRASAESCDAPRILFVIDSSSSMLDDVTEAGISTPKWDVAQAAVKAVTDAFPDEAQWGLMTFPAASGGCTTGQVTVDIGPGTGAQIQTTLAALPITVGSRQTPAGQSLMAASTYGSITDSAHKNYVIFLTDGWQYCSVPTSSAPACIQSNDCTLMGVTPCPTCNSCSTSSTDPSCAGKSADSCYCVRSWPVLGVEALADAGVTTYVVGFGSNADYKTLNAAAKAGGTALAGCDPASTSPSCYYQASVPSDLNAALSDIVQKVVTEVCTGDCGIQGSRTCKASGWSDCQAPSEIDCQSQCGTQGKQKCVNGVLSACDALCEEAGTDGAAGAAGAGGAAGKGGSAGAGGAAGQGGAAGAGGAAGQGGAGGAGGSTVDAGQGGLGGEPALGPQDSGDDGGCGCRTAPASRTGSLAAFLALAFALWRSRRRD